MQRVGKYEIPDDTRAIISDMEDTIVLPGEGERIKKRHLIRPLLTNPSWEKLSAAYFLITRGKTCSVGEKMGALLTLCEGMYQDSLYAAGREMAGSIDPDVEEIFLRCPGAKKAVVSMNTIQEARPVVDRMNIDGCGIGTVVANYVGVDSNGRLTRKFGGDRRAIDGGEAKCYEVKQLLSGWNVDKEGMKGMVYLTDGAKHEEQTMDYVRKSGGRVVLVTGGRKPGMLSRYSSIVSLTGGFF
jgi:hypothetical protein